MIAGWKIGINDPAIQRRLDLREPLVGRLPAAARIPDGGAYDATRASHLRAEAELAVRVGDGATAAAIELVDVGDPPADVAGILAGNIFHRAFALGEPAPAGMPRLIVNGVEHPPQLPLPDLEETLALVTRNAGEQLRPDHWIISGAVAHVRVGAGDRVRVDLDGAGAVEVTIRARKG